MLRTGRSLVPPSEDFVHGASPAGSRLTVAVSYRAAWSLPEPVSHRLVDVDLCGSNPFWTITSFPESPAIWVHQDSGSTLNFGANTRSLVTKFIGPSRGTMAYEGRPDQSEPLSRTRWPR